MDTDSKIGDFEEALDADISIVDAHFHTWDVSPFGPGHAVYSAQDYFDDIKKSGHRIVGTVYVEALTSYKEVGPDELKSVGETEYAEKVGQLGRDQRHDVGGASAGIVINADLSRRDIDDIIDAHIAASPRVKGVRLRAHSAEGVPSFANTPLGLLRQEQLWEGVRTLARRDLAFDCTVYQTQLEDVSILAKACPATTIILGHLGGPLGSGRYSDNRSEHFEQWRNALSQVSANPNVFLKVGGLNHQSTGLGAHDLTRPFGSEQMVAAQKAHILTAIDLFGPDRCMFESNFPGDKSGISYAALWNGFKILTEGFSIQERAEMFSGTAQRAYRLDI